MPHPYATDSDERRNVTVVLVLFSVVLAFLISMLLAKLSLTIPSWAESPSILLIFGLLYALFKKALWKHHIFRRVGLVKTPVLAGKWNGYIISSHDGHQERRNVSVEIDQDWTNMVIKLKGRDSHSYSVTATLLTGDGKLLSYEYQNEPHASAPETMHSHRGQTRLSIAESLTEMDGDYFSGRDRQNFGSLHLEKDSTNKSRA